MAEAQYIMDYATLLDAVASGEGDAYGYVNLKRKFDPVFRKNIIHYRNAMVEKKRNDYFVVPNTEGNVKLVHDHFTNPKWHGHFFARFIPTHLIDVNCDFYLWDNKVGIYSFERGREVVNIIGDITMYKLYKQFWDIMWGIALEEPIFFGSRTSQLTALEKEMYLSPKKVIDLTVSYPSGVNPSWIEKVAETIPSSFSKANPSLMIDRLKEYFTGKFKTGNALITPTATLSLLIAADTCLETPGDEFIIFQPGYESYPHIVRSEGGNIVYAKRKNNLHPDIDDLRSKITKRTVAIIITLPENPFGIIYTEKELREIIGLCVEHGITLIVDSVFYDIIPYGKKMPLVAEFAEAKKLNYMIIGETGKILGLDGTKLACITFTERLEDKLMHKTDNYFFQLPKYDLYVIDKIVNDKRFSSYIKSFNSLIRENYEYMEDNINPAIKPIKMEGSSTIRLDISKLGIKDIEFMKIMKERYNLGVAPCSYFYDFAAPDKYNYIRIALGRPKDQIMKATKLMNLFAKGFTDC